MYTLLIVDDEILTREGLCTTIDWQSENITVVGTAENGKQGLELARKLKPDLIIADVRMPVMDGLDMARVLFEEDADTAVVILSGYADFESARRALKSGVTDFLLKPIDNAELVVRMRAAIEKLDRKRHENRLLGQYRDNLPLLKRHRLEEYLKGNMGEAALEDAGVTFPAAGTLVYVSTADEIEKFVTLSAEAFKDGVCVAQQLSGGAIIVTDCPEGEVKVRIKGVLDKLLKVSAARFSVAVCAYSGTIVNAYKRAKQLSQNVLFKSLNTVASEEGIGDYKKLVRDAIGIIEKDYDKKITVKSVAYDLYTSESHLMHEFKNQVGKTFNECLTDFRMLKALELLVGGGMRINEIAYAVGYTDVKYFGQVFKEYTGCTPSEYLQTHTK